MRTEAVIFDLDGIVVSTDEYHYQAWKRLAKGEGIYFDRRINQRLRGVSRMASLEILLEKSSKKYTAEQKKLLADRKNSYYRRLLKKLTPQDILSGVMELLTKLKSKGIKIAIASSSKNATLILDRIGLGDYFDATVDGNEIYKSKPDPEVFLLAAKRLGVAPVSCLVVEDAAAGVEAALAGGMRVIGIGCASNERVATVTAEKISEISVDSILFC